MRRVLFALENPQLDRGFRLRLEPRGRRNYNERRETVRQKEELPCPLFTSN